MWRGRFCIFFLFSLLLAAAADGPRVLVIGDSLTEGYGIAKDKSYPTLVEERLKKAGHPGARVINAGTSGATSAFGERTIRFHTQRARPDVIIYALGSNDGLRGLAVAETEKNVENAIILAQKEKIPIILAGLKAPPNYGNKFPKEFEAIFPKLAAKYQVPFIPFLLEGVAGNPKLNQADGIHPNEEGYKVVADLVFAAVNKVL